MRFSSSYIRRQSCTLHRDYTKTLSYLADTLSAAANTQYLFYLYILPGKETSPGEESEDTSSSSSEQTTFIEHFFRAVSPEEEAEPLLDPILTVTESETSPASHSERVPTPPHFSVPPLCPSSGLSVALLDSPLTETATSPDPEFRAPVPQPGGLNTSCSFAKLLSHVDVLILIPTPRDSSELPESRRAPLPAPSLQQPLQLSSLFRGDSS